MKSKRQQSPFTVSLELYHRQVDRLVSIALGEDIGRGDQTVHALGLDTRRKGHALLRAKSAGVLAGRDAFEATFRELDHNAKFKWHKKDGETFRRGATIVTLTARTDAILTAERTAINFIARLSGIATATRHMVDSIPKNTAQLLDTRKTTPGWRYLEKYATVIGGACNHRIGLHDAIMIKDNHIAACGGLTNTLKRMKQRRHRVPVICEVQNLNDIRQALSGGVDWLLCDNFTAERLRKAVRLIRQFDNDHERHTVIEVSGNITAKSIAKLARTGVDFVSSGAITHSSAAIDFSLEWSK